MKYWKIPGVNTPRIKFGTYYEEYETKPPLPYFLFSTNTKDYDWTEISKNEYDLHKLYNVELPLTNPETNQPWVGNEKETWISNQLQEQEIIAHSDKGLLADDIVLLHLSLLELLTNYINWLPYSALAEKQRFKIIIETLIKYNLELVNKDYDPNFTISNRDKGVLLTALTKVKEEYPEHFALMAKPFKLEAEATPDEVWTAYEKQMEILHKPAIDPNTAPGGSETLAGQLPTDAGGTQHPTK